ncbi:MAG: GspG family T2SS major pseudopilin variant XcpT [Planctomycetaceae bacterium]
MKSQRRNQRRRKRSGFTLMEVLLVLAILGVIAAMVVPQLMGTQEEAMRDRARLDMKAIEDAVKKYTLKHDGSFPETLEQLTNPEPLEDGTTPAPYLEAENKIDPWGNKYIYRMPSTSNQYLNDGRRPEIYSFGPDKQDNQGEEPADVNNWSERLRKRQKAQ